jgi:hypothetical protein
LVLASPLLLLRLLAVAASALILDLARLLSLLSLPSALLRLLGVTAVATLLSRPLVWLAIGSIGALVRLRMDAFLRPLRASCILVALTTLRGAILIATGFLVGLILVFEGA